MTPLSFDSVDAIHTGGSYVVAKDGRPVRDDANSGPLEQVAEGAPGQSAELKAADGKTGVELAPAHSEATAKVTPIKKP